MRTIATVVIGLIVLIGGLLGLFYMLAKGMAVDPALLAIMLTLIFIVLILWAGFASVQNIMHARSGTQPVWLPPPEDLSERREVPNYRPPIARLPPPQTIIFPRFTDAGVQRPLVTLPPPNVETVMEDGRSVSIPRPMLLRFVGLDTPRRGEWSGDNAMYGKCLIFCEQHGLLVRNAKGGATWNPNYPKESRLAWAGQGDVSADSGQETDGQTDSRTDRRFGGISGAQEDNNASF